MMKYRSVVLHISLRKWSELVYESMSENKHKQLRVRAQVCTLIADLFDYVVYDVRFGDLATRNDQELTVAIIEFLEQHLEEENITELTCKKFGLSRKSLDRNLKMTLGSTGKEMIENLRVEKAKNLLKNTNKNMNYILDACGFGSEKTFYRVFREETGVTPNVFRQKGQVDHYDQALKGYLDYETTEVKKLFKGNPWEIMKILLFILLPTTCYTLVVNNKKYKHGKISRKG